jgi:hypothetical protein
MIGVVIIRRWRMKFSKYEEHPGYARGELKPGYSFKYNGKIATIEKVDDKFALVALRKVGSECRGEPFFMSIDDITRCVDSGGYHEDQEGSVKGVQ